MRTKKNIKIIIIIYKYRNFSTNKIGEIDLNEQCDQSGCLTELFIQLAIILIGKQIFNNFTEVLIPLFKNKFKKSNLLKKELKQWEKDFDLGDWNHLTLFDEYLEMIIQFGLIVMVRQMHLIYISNRNFINFILFSSLSWLFL